MRDEERPDAGLTMIDVMMAMTVMTIVMAVVTSGMLSMFRSSKTLEARSDAQSQLSTGLQRLDHEIKYAAGIGQEYVSGGAQFIDFLTVEGGRKRCVQLRLKSTVLAQRSWTFQADPIDLSAWTQLATGITNPAPFSRKNPTPVNGHQQLQVALTAGATGATSADWVVFTALNTDRMSGNDYCSAARTLP